MSDWADERAQSIIADCLWNVNGGDVVDHPRLEKQIADALRSERAAKGCCEVCFTSSWQPCEETFPSAVKDPATSGYMICGYCMLSEALTAKRVAGEALYKVCLAIPAFIPKTASEVAMERSPRDGRTLLQEANEAIAAWREAAK